ncbi:molybdopterin synthase sulfur carrier subunit [Halorubrum aquaticum]|uniref:Molybdopterin synthase sulfur carrier subunit n=1 Tax=Halorubrum aquaticum TaxID=387340 RepID=A0A1I2ZHZ4_9EURY|nr:molybdopterin synthase sulfur carrier subunit [Halorubrum aquaticum]
MELELRFFATFREAAGGKTVVREFADGSDVGDVLRALEDEYDGMDGRLIVDGGLAPQINVLKNGREVLHLQGLDTDLADGDRLSVFPPVAGGTTDADAAGDSGGGDADGNGDGDNDDAADGEEPPTEPSAEPGWVRREVAYRGISRRLAAHYLTNLGGDLVGTDDPAAATRVDGEGWRATLAAATVTAAASITLTEVTVSFAGEESVLEELLPKFERKAMRAGG